MKQKALFFVSILLVVAYCVVIDDPLNSFISFLLAGAVPQTDIMLGLWPTLCLALLLLFGVRSFIRHIRMRSLELTARQIKAEKLSNEFKDSHLFEDQPKATNAVVAAQSSDTPLL